MATITMGTTAQTSLNPSKKFLNGIGGSGISAADLASINLAIKDDLGNAHAIVPGALSSMGLVIPNRGILKVLPGDYIGVDSAGWPILVSAYSIANAAWIHS